MNSYVTLQWATPDIDKQIMYMARVSNPEGQNSEKTRLLYYCMEHGHVSPFEMANVCLEINTTRDIGRQILRHRSFSFQEFSQRYEDVSKLGDFVTRECRLQDKKNRQNSIETSYEDQMKRWGWESLQHRVTKEAETCYKMALNMGIAKEQARALLPEGLTMSRMYMNGNMRSWIFYLKQRLDPTTQKEHREVAQQVLEVLRTVAPITMDAFFGDEK
jgi:thymidylate synthase (FAD)